MEGDGERLQLREERLKQWMQAYGDSVLRTCYVWLKDRQLSEDAAQDTFLKAWRAMDRFEDQHEGSDRAWLMRIAANTCRDYQRNNWFRRVDQRVPIEELPQSLFRVEDEDRSLFLSILDMPLKQRQMILMYHYQGLNLREVAQALDINLSSAHRRLKKAEAMLRVQLEGGLGYAKR